jgi:hypothetical protein
LLAPPSTVGVNEEVRGEIVMVVGGVLAPGDTVAGIVEELLTTVTPRGCDRMSARWYCRKFSL